MFFKSSKSNATPVSQNRTQGFLEKLAERMPLDPANYFYLRNWAVSSYEKFGLNDNADGFEHKELQASHGTFQGSWTCLDHENHHISLAVGENIDVVYLPDEHVELVMAVNRKKVEARRPGLERRIIEGTVTDTSMGCWARESVCTICGNVATDESQYCDDIRWKRGQKICNAQTHWQEKTAGELNRGVVFFEDSIITDADGADKNAKILAKIASVKMYMTGPKSVSADRLYQLLKTEAKTASREQAAYLTLLTRRLTELLD